MTLFSKVSLARLVNFLPLTCPALALPERTSRPLGLTSHRGLFGRVYLGLSSLFRCQVRVGAGASPVFRRHSYTAFRSDLYEAEGNSCVGGMRLPRTVGSQHFSTNVLGASKRRSLTQSIDRPILFCAGRYRFVQLDGSPRRERPEIPS